VYVTKVDVGRRAASRIDQLPAALGVLALPEQRDERETLRFHTARTKG
jgi:hypothetical protein